MPRKRPLLQSILVPLDGSPFAERALPLALELARRSRAKLRLALVHHGAPPPVSSDALELYAEVEKVVLKSERGYLRRVGARVAKTLGRSVQRAFLEGPVARALVAHAAEVGAELVVMSTHGRGPLRRIWLGSVADRLIRTLDVPILLVRPEEESEARPADTSAIAQILVPLDGSPLAESALDPAGKMATLFGAELLLIQVVPPVVVATDPPLPYPTGIEEELTGVRLDQSQDYLDGVVEQLREQGLTATGVAVAGIDVPATILQLASAPRVGLLALATHGRGGVSRLFLGSITDKLIRSAELPVLVCRPTRSSVPRSRRKASGRQGRFRH
jgi:nucleotide-binding universal stress UspA family protein